MKKITKSALLNFMDSWSTLTYLHNPFHTLVQNHRSCNKSTAPLLTTPSPYQNPLSFSTNLTRYCLKPSRSGSSTEREKKRRIHGRSYTRQTPSLVPCLPGVPQSSQQLWDQHLPRPLLLASTATN